MPDNVRYVISVVCGNDIYGSNFDSALGLAIEDYAEAVELKARTHYAVVGMSAATWQYDEWRACAYDIDARKMSDAFQVKCVPTCSGAAEMRKLMLADAIGHVHPDSKCTMFDA